MGGYRLITKQLPDRCFSLKAKVDVSHHWLVQQSCLCVCEVQHVERGPRLALKAGQLLPDTF